MRYLVVLFFCISLYADSISYTLSYIEDKTERTFNQIKLQDFQEVHGNYLNKGFMFNPVWLKLHITNNSNQPIQRIFTFDNPTVDYIDFFENDKLTISTGDKRKVQSRGVHDISFAFFIDLKPKEEKSFYFKIRTNNTFSIRFDLLEHNEYLNHAETKKVFLVFFSAFILAIMLYNLFLFIILKESRYFYYVLFQCSILIIMWSFSGTGYYFIWRDNVEFNEFSIRFFDDLTIVLGIVFTRSFLNIKEQFPKIDKLVLVMLALLLYVMITPWDWHYLIIKPVMIGSLFAILLVAIYAAYKNIPTAKLYLLGWFVLIVAAATTLLKNFGLLEINFFTTWGIYLGSMLEALILSIALAKRIEILKKEKQLALELSKEKLNSEVEKKTASLNEALSQKELLLKEIHHRVKNNLQIISAFISVASLKNSGSKEVFLSLQDRIRAMSLLHEHLYRYDDLQYIDISSYIMQLVNTINTIHNRHNVEVEYKIYEVKIEFDKTIILGLIINELVTNAFKYAFEDVTNPKIEILLRKIGTKFELVVEDNGKGFEEIIDIKHIDTLGLKMVYRLATKQLDGNIDTELDNKTCFKITF